MAKSTQIRRGKAHTTIMPFSYLSTALYPDETREDVVLTGRRKLKIIMSLGDGGTSASHTRISMPFMKNSHHAQLFIGWCSAVTV